MVEHRLIERVIKVARKRLEKATTEGKVDSVFVEGLVDFFAAYADRCHHGKEEDILFRELGLKELTPEDRRILEELIEEHKSGRRMVKSLREANERYRRGDAAVLPQIAENLRWLVDFYPGHILKEDKRFFIPVMHYFNDEEKEAMIRRGYAFDSQLLHREYEVLVSRLEIEGGPA